MLILIIIPVLTTSSSFKAVATGLKVHTKNRSRLISGTGEVENREGRTGL